MGVHVQKKIHYHCSVEALGHDQSVGLGTNGPNQTFFNPPPATPRYSAEIPPPASPRYSGELQNSRNGSPDSTQPLRSESLPTKDQKHFWTRHRLYICAMASCLSLTAVLIVSVLALFANGIPVPPPAGVNPIVALDYGSFMGYEQNGVNKWKGIPFAAPPIGDLRFRAPQPPYRFTGVFNASSVCCQNATLLPSLRVGVFKFLGCLGRWGHMTYHASYFQRVFKADHSFLV